MPQPPTTGGSGLSRSEAAILAWKKRTRAAPKPGALDPKIAARVKEILAAKQKKPKAKAAPKGKGKAAPKVDPAKAKAKADKVAAAEKAKAERAGRQLSADARRETAKRERDKAKAEKVTAAQAKQAATLAKQKQAAGKVKEKAKAAAKPAKKEAADPAKKQSENRAKVAKDMADQDAGLSPSGSAALGDFADGKPLDDKTASQFEAMGLTERGSDGAHRLTSEGRAAAAAMSKGDTRGAIDAISRAADKKKQGEDTVNAKNKAANERATAQAAKDKAAADKKKPKETKAMPDEYAIKQDAEERAMFAAMDEKGTRKTPKGSGGDKAKGGGGGGSGGSSSGGGGGGSSSASLSHHSDAKIAHMRETAQSDINENAKQIRAVSAEHRDITRRANASSDEAEQNKLFDKADVTSAKLKKLNIERERLNKHFELVHDEGVARARAKTDAMAGKAIDMSDDTLFSLDDLLAIKAGARHSRTDMQHLQGIHDSSVACGASCGPESDDSGEGDAEDDDAATDAIKSIMDDPRYYAQHECGDVMQACSALQTLCMLIQSELGEDDEDGAQCALLCDACDTLVEFIQSELAEMRGASKDTIGHQPMKGIEIETLDDGEEIATVSGSSVKALSEPGMVGGYLVKFGGEGDLSQWRDVFTKNTNFGKHTKTDVWVHHRMLPGLGKQQLTNQAELGMDDEGVFVKHLFNLRSSYESKLYGMAQQGKLGWSSGTAPHLVERKALGDGRHEVLQWMLGLDASYTPTPAGGLEVNASALKTAFLAELGLEGIDTDSEEAITAKSTRPDGVEVDQVRARKLLLELDILALETAQ